jgi:O-antigen/teichoic acid export membrane protein
MAAKIAQLFWLLPQLVSSMLFPLTALEHEVVNEGRFRKMVRFTFIATATAAVLAAIVYPFFSDIILGDAYQPSYQYFVALLPGVVLFTAAIILAARLAGQGKVKVNMQASAICFVVVLLLDLLLIPTMAGKGAAIATSIGYTLTSAYIYMRYYRWIK